MSDDKNSVLQIDLAAVLRQKLGKRARFVPRFLVRAIERFIYADRMNELLRSNHGKTDADFCRGVLKDLKVSISVKNVERLPSPENRRVIIVSNHPLGGLDGLALIDFFQKRYGGQVYFIVNDMLMAIEPLRNVFVPVNKHGAQSRQSALTIEHVFNSNDPVLIFPAGLCSRLGDDGVIADLEWKKMFVKKAIEYQRNIIPVFFSGENSRFFYKFARLRKRSGLKLNIEMVQLPREVFGHENGTLQIICGQQIHWQRLNGGKHANCTAQEIKQSVYNLKNEQ